MDVSERNPLIINGTILAREGNPLPPRGGDFDEEKKYKRNLREAQVFLRTKISRMKNVVKGISPELKLSNENFFKIDYPSAFLAKSYQVSSIYKFADLKIVGSSSWIDDDGEEGKSDFLSGSYEQIELFESVIENPEAKIHKKEIRRMENIELLKPYQPDNFFKNRKFQV